MKRYPFSFLTFAVLFLLTIPFVSNRFSLSFATSVVPGWHTTIFPPYFLVNLFVSAILLLVAVAHYKLFKRGYRMNRAVFIVQLIVTIPVVVHILFPSSFEEFLLQKNGGQSMQMFMWMIFAAYLLFITGKLIFFVYFYRAIKAKKTF